MIYYSGINIEKETLKGKENIENKKILMKKFKI